MTYVTQSDLIDLFGVVELTELTNPDGDTPDASKVAKAIEDAEALIDSYLAGAYTLPLESAPKVLNRTAANIARKYLYESDGRIPTEGVQKSHDEAIKLLKEISKGIIELGVTVSGSVVKELDTAEIVGDTERVFSKDKLAGF